MEAYLIKEIKDFFNPRYKGMIISREPPFFESVIDIFNPFSITLNKYFLLVQNTKTGEYKLKKIGKKTCTRGGIPSMIFVSDIRLDNLTITEKGIEAKVTKVSSAFGDERNKTFFIPRNKFPN